MLIKTSHGHLPLPCSDNTWELRSSKTSKRSAKVNAFLYVLFSPPIAHFTSLCHHWFYSVLLGVGCLGCAFMDTSKQHWAQDLRVSDKITHFFWNAFLFYEILSLGYLILCNFRWKGCQTALNAILTGSFNLNVTSWTTSFVGERIA